MYHFREETLKNGDKTENILVIDFDDPEMAIIGEYLMADASLLNGEILHDFNQVLAGKKKQMRISGNRCGLEIGQEETLVYDLFEDMGVDCYPEVRISTRTLQELTVMWLKKLQAFQNQQQ